MDWIVERGVEGIPEGVSFERATLSSRSTPASKPWCSAIRSLTISCWSWARADRPDVHYAGPPHRRARGRYRCHGRAPRHLPRAAARTSPGIRVEPTCRPGQGPHRRPGSRRRHRGCLGPASSNRPLPAPARARGFCFSPRPRIRSESKLRARISVSVNEPCSGRYSASMDLQKESADLVFSGELPVEELISHCLPLG